MKYYFLGAACFILTACVNTMPTTSSASLENGLSPKKAVVYPRAGFKSMSFEQGPCHGYCPVYRFDVGNDSRYSYNGERHVSVEGAQKGVLDDAALNNLRMHFEALASLSLPSKIGRENCELYATDHSTVQLSYLGDKAKLNFKLDLGCHQFQHREDVLMHIEGIKKNLPLNALVHPADK